MRMPDDVRVIPGPKFEFKIDPAIADDPRKVLKWDFYVTHVIRNPYAYLVRKPRRR